MASIFLSYRRSDSVAWAKLLRDSIATNLPEVRVFRDIDAILPGDNFVQIITDAVASCDVLIALIGPTWRSATNVATGRPRLFESNDFTRIEIATALRRGVRVIPVLVGGAAMPVSDELPEDLQALCERQNVELSDRAWDDACRHLADVLARVLAPPRGAPLPPPPQQMKPEPQPHAGAHAEEANCRTASSSSSTHVTRSVILGLIVSGLGVLVAVTPWIVKVSAPWIAKVSAPTTTPEEPTTPHQPSVAAPPIPPPVRPPSLLELDLEGTWRPFTNETPKLNLVVRRDGGSLELGYELLGGAEAGKNGRIGRIAVTGDAMSFTGSDELKELQIEMRRQGESPREWSVNILSPKGPVATGTASVDDSGHQWSASLDFTKDGTKEGVLEVHGWVSTDGGQLLTKVQPIPRNGAQAAPLEFVFVREKR